MLHIIDSSGSRDFLAMRHLYYRTGDAFMVGLLSINCFFQKYYPILNSSLFTAKLKQYKYLIFPHFQVVYSANDRSSYVEAIAMINEIQERNTKDVRTL